VRVVCLSALLDLVDEPLHRLDSLVRKLVLLIQLDSLEDSLLREVPYNTEGLESRTDDVVLVVNFSDLGGGIGEGLLDLGNGLRVDSLRVLNVVVARGFEGGGGERGLVMLTCLG
jgi:hypothetical protein